MELRNIRLIFGYVLVVTPCLCQLPAFPIPGEVTTDVPTVLAPQPAPQTVLVPKVDFDFKGFFDYFVKIYGKSALTVFQEKLDGRKKDEGLTTSTTIPGLPIPCALAPAQSGATITYEAPNRIHGSTASYHCGAGYRGNDVIVMCMSGSWTPANVSCEMVYCGRPSPMPNGRANFQDLAYNALATYTCDPGYQADDIPSPVRCLADGTWSKPTFRCTNMMASTQQMSTQMASGGMGGMMGGMASMMQAMSGGSPGGAPGAGAGLNSGLMGALAQAMSAGNTGGAGAPGGGLGGMLSSMMGNGMGGGGAPPGPGALPEHLQMLGKMAPALMPNFMGGMSPNFGMGAGAAAAGPAKPMEPEEQMMMMMMMQNMQRQRMMEVQQQRQQELQRQQQLEAQKQQQQQQQQQPQPQGSPTSGGINLSNLLSLASAAQGGNTGASGASNPMMTALQSLQKALNQVMASQGPSTGAGAVSGGTPQTSGTSSSSSSSQPTSVFGNRPSSSSTSGSSDPLRDAVMAAGLNSAG